MTPSLGSRRGVNLRVEYIFTDSCGAATRIWIMYSAWLTLYMTWIRTYSSKCFHKTGYIWIEYRTLFICPRIQHVGAWSWNFTIISLSLYIYIYIYAHIYMNIYIYIQRERDHALCSLSRRIQNWTAGGGWIISG